MRSPNVVCNISRRSIVSLLTAIAATNDFNALQVAVAWLRKIPIILLALLFLIVHLQGTADQPNRFADQCTEVARATVLPVKIEQANAPRERNEILSSCNPPRV